MTPHPIHDEIDRNFDYFQRNLGSYLPSNEGRFALLRNASLVVFCDSAAEAEMIGERDFPDEMFSIQEVTNSPVDLGFFTHAFDNGYAQ